MLDLSHLRIHTFRARTRDHISYVLPDGKHVVDLYFSDISVHCYIREDFSAKEVLKFPIIKSKSPHWADLVHQFCELAHKNFPKPLGHLSRSNAYQRRAY